jgi:ribosomal protein S24E
MVVEVLHPARPNVSKSELGENLAKIYKTDKNRVVCFGFRTQFGGGRSTGFALIYDDEASQKKFEPRYRLVRVRNTFAVLTHVKLNTNRSPALLRKSRSPHASFGRSAKIVRRRYVRFNIAFGYPFAYDRFVVL